jgi:8-oxo-dGTP pyrophosphatase MutT (NUDIX family)
MDQQGFPDGIVFMLIKNRQVLAEKCELTKKVVAGAFALPGGQMESGEAPEDALRRALLEALDILPARMTYICTLLDRVQEFRKLHYFVIEDWRGEISDCAAAAWRWVPLEQAHTFDRHVDRVAISEYIRLATGPSLPQDNRAYRFPISVKGVVLHAERVVLLQNERDEWELPGGKLEPGESPEDCVIREMHEELGLPVSLGPLLDSWVYHIAAGVEVLIVTYGCYPAPCASVTHSPEHKAVGLFTLQEMQALPMPAGYKKSIQTWIEQQTMAP